MIDILYIKNKELLLSEIVDSIESLIGDDELDRALRYRRWQDKQAYLLGKLLLAKHLANSGYDLKLLKDVCYTKFNRPYLKINQVDFNISHSGDFVICAFSIDQMVGIDIEKFQSIDLDIYNYILNENDKERIAISTDKYSSFFGIWSAKEAILKAHGCGLVNDLDRIEINGETGVFNNTAYYLKKLDIHPSYSTIVSSSTPVENVVVKETFIDNCLHIVNYK